MIVDFAELAEDWTSIRDPGRLIVIENRASPLEPHDIGALLAQAPFGYRAKGKVPDILQVFAELPKALKDDIAQLADRFMALMDVDAVRVRVEGTVNNACKKVHADYTDIRLITTYAGPGTEYAPHGDDCCLERVPTGAVALFKGKLFAAGHAPCMHRSPPIEGSGEARLLLVIDTPLLTQNIQY